MLQNLLTGINRINNFLISEEIDQSNIIWKEKTDNFEENAIEIKNGNFYWVNPKITQYLVKKELKKNAELEKKFSISACLKKKKSDNKNNDKKTKNQKKNSSIVHKSKEEQLEEPLIIKTKESKNLTIDRELKRSILSHNSNSQISNDSYNYIQKNFTKLDLIDININISKGSCVAIIGETGSGKSSLILSLFGELFYQKKEDIPKDETYLKPEVYINGSASYVSQKQWIRSLSIKENIIFGLQILLSFGSNVFILKK